MCRLLLILSAHRCVSASSWRGGSAAASAPRRVSPSVRSRPCRPGHGQRQRLPRSHPASSCPSRASRSGRGGVAPSDPRPLTWARDTLWPTRRCQDLKPEHRTPRAMQAWKLAYGRTGLIAPRAGLGPSPALSPSRLRQDHSRSCSCNPAVTAQASNRHHTCRCASPEKHTDRVRVSSSPRQITTLRANVVISAPSAIGTRSRAKRCISIVRRAIRKRAFATQPRSPAGAGQRRSFKALHASTCGAFAFSPGSRLARSWAP